MDAPRPVVAYRSTPVHPGETHTPLDERAFESIVRHEFPALAWDAFAILGEVDAAIETVERVFLDAWQARHELRSVEALLPTLGAAVRHDAMRERTLRATRRPAGSTDQPAVTVPGADATWQRIRTAIGMLDAASSRPALAGSTDGDATREPTPRRDVPVAPPDGSGATVVPAEPVQRWARSAGRSSPGSPPASPPGPRTSGAPRGSTRRPAMRATAAHRIADLGHVNERRRTRLVAGSIAGLALLAAAGWFLTRPVSEARLDAALDAEGGREVAPAAGDRAVIELADGSRVTIAPTARVLVPAAMPKGVRGVRLDGMALFDVAEDEKAPFLVRTAFGTVRVTGTKFAALADTAGGRLVVHVLEGSVALEHGDSAFAVAADRGAVLRRDGTMEIVTERYVAEALGWTGDSLDLAGRPVAEVLAVLPRWIGREIIVADTMALGQRLEGRLDVSSASAAEADLAARLGLRVDTTEAGRRLVSAASVRTSERRPAAARGRRDAGARTAGVIPRVPDIAPAALPDVDASAAIDLPPPPKIRRPPGGAPPTP